MTDDDLSGQIPDFIQGMLGAKGLGANIAHHRLLAAREADFADPARPLSAVSRQLLAEAGIPALYSHQATALNLARSGRHVVVATPTASGKSLTYLLPVLEALSQDPDSHAMYLSPLKALAQDQLRHFEEFVSPLPVSARPQAAVYDGDTPDAARRKIRKRPPGLLLTNPEMLHLGILAHHEIWSTYLAGLRYVVVDEAHTYRGVMGSHMAHVFRRLTRLAARFGAAPTFILLTATIGNPGELAEKLIGEPAEVITESGAPAAPRHFVFLDPLESPAKSAITLLRAALPRGLRTIVYCGSRKMTELIAMWAASRAGPHRHKISAYRSGYLPEERRDIEARMSSGELLAVITTSALELGIDVGGLDLCLLVGYPGSVMSTWQRGGRVGRAGRESAVVLLGGEDALDQYFLRHPEDFFSRPPEQAVIYPANRAIAAKHLVCAASEHPLSLAEPYLADPALRRVATAMTGSGELLERALDGALVTGRKRPQREVDLRGSGRQYAIMAGSQVLGQIDEYRAHRETHPGAVYLHRGATYAVTELDCGAMRAHVAEVEADWHTRPRAKKTTDILEVVEQADFHGARLFFGRLRVTEQVTGYERRANRGQTLLGIVPLDLPAHVFETEGFFIAIPRGLQKQAEDEMLHFMGGIHALEHAMIGLMPLVVMADRGDFGGISTPLHAQLGRAAVFVYDGVPGGIGLSRAGFQQAKDLFGRTLALLHDCECEAGCPSCVHSPKCGSGNRPIDKFAAFRILELLTQGAHPETGDLEVSPAPPPPPSQVQPGQPAPVAAPDQTGQAHAPAYEPEEPERPAQAAETSALSPGRDAPARARRKSPRQTPGRADARPTWDAPNPTGPVERFAVLDIETQRSAQEVGGWHKPQAMGISVAVLYDSATDDFRTYLEADIPRLLEELPGFPLVVGFNIKRFDYGVMQGYGSFAKPPTLDMLEVVSSRLGYRLSLDSLAKATLNAPKSASGLDALRWWKEGKIAEIERYCRDDVRLTRDLYLFGRDNRHLLFTNKAGSLVKLPIEWD